MAPPALPALRRLAEVADTTDGAYPISEQIVLQLQRDGEPATHLLIHESDGELAGYAYVDISDPAGPAAELVVHPLRRHRGHGHTLVTSALAVAREHDPAGRLRIWAHGDHPSAGAIALRLGFERARVLLQLRRTLPAEIPQPPLPDGVSMRAFRPGEDDEAWLAVNSRAFADHPEQGRWTRQDLLARMAEPWFDPAGFLLAVEDATGRLLGFHWTKVHGGSETAEPPGGGTRRERPPIGEVYVVGVDPSAHGLGLGKALTVAGLRHLHHRGLHQVMLYVDESNTAAVALYQRLGFAHWTAHVQYRHA
ncbi:MAG TPA: mycothiol synthase [Micromonosporaceae bacterium]|nr:mycothiol synthase [Micromonosporaceae bacterium]